MPKDINQKTGKREWKEGELTFPVYRKRSAYKTVPSPLLNQENTKKRMGIIKVLVGSTRG